MKTYINTIYSNELTYDLVDYIQKIQKEQEQKRAKILHRIKQIKSK